MKLLETKCPHCGANLKIDAEKKQATCDFCGAVLILDDETNKLKIADGETFGYQFEKGRQRAHAEAAAHNTVSPASQTPQQKPKRKTWLWVLGWIFIFPVPLMLILNKKKDMDKKLRIGIIVAAWVVYGILLVIGMVNNNSKPKTDNINAVSETTTTAVTTTEPTTIAPTTAEPTTAAPTTQKPTQKPTEKPTEAATPIVFTSYTNVVEAGANASVTIQGKPNTEYDIIVNYSSGVSNAAGLENKTTDSNGVVTWEWEVGTKTTPGTYTISVRGGGTEETVNFEVVNRI